MGLEESREKLKQLFKDNPDIARAFKETLDEMSKPENVEKAVNEICKGLEVIQKLRGEK